MKWERNWHSMKIEQSSKPYKEGRMIYLKMLLALMMALTLAACGSSGNAVPTSLVQAVIAAANGNLGVSDVQTGEADGREFAYAFDTKSLAVYLAANDKGHVSVVMGTPNTDNEPKTGNLGLENLFDFYTLDDLGYMRKISSSEISSQSWWSQLLKWLISQAEKNPWIKNWVLRKIDETLYNVLGAGQYYYVQKIVAKGQCDAVYPTLLQNLGMYNNEWINNRVSKWLFCTALWPV